MSVTLNAKGTSVSTFIVGKNGLKLSQSGIIEPPLGNDLVVSLEDNRNLIIDAGTEAPALITTTNNQDLHINPAVAGGQYLLLNATRWPTTAGGAGQTLVSDGNGILSWQPAAGTGTVNNVSVITANGFAGTVTSPGLSPEISIRTTVTGLLKGDGTSASAASATDITTLVDSFYVNITGDTMTGALNAPSFNATSTIRVKNNVVDLREEYISKFCRLRPKEYNVINTGRHEFGFIAEEMAEVYPEVVGIDSNGDPLGIDYGKLTTILTAKLQEQQLVIDDLKSQVCRITELLKSLVLDK